MNTTTALKTLYAALGGSAADVKDMTTIPMLINAIASLISTQGIAALPTGTDGQVLTMDDGEWVAANVPAELPAVTAADNGKVLKVVEGEWAAGSDATE